MNQDSREKTKQQTAGEVFIQNEASQRRVAGIVDVFDETFNDFYLSMHHVFRSQYGNFIERVYSKIWLFLKFRKAI